LPVGQEMVERRIGLRPDYRKVFSALDMESHSNRLLNWPYEQEVPVILRCRQEDAAKDGAEAAFIRQWHLDLTAIDTDLVKG
jgi:hypothetical protein